MLYCDAVWGMFFYLNAFHMNLVCLLKYLWMAFVRNVRFFLRWGNKYCVLLFYCRFWSYLSIHFFFIRVLCKWTHFIALNANTIKRMRQHHLHIIQYINKNYWLYYFFLHFCKRFKCGTIFHSRSRILFKKTERMI